MLMIGVTTVKTRDSALILAEGLISKKLAACVQIDGPITSIYAWEGRVEHTEEFRLSVKFTSANARHVEAYVLANHPYDIPEWAVIRAENVSEKYLSWVNASSSN